MPRAPRLSRPGTPPEHRGVRIMPREITDMRIVSYDVPADRCAGYYPECNPLISGWHHADGSKTPAAK